MSRRLTWWSPFEGGGWVTLTGSDAGKVSSSPSSRASSSRRFSSAIVEPARREQRCAVRSSMSLRSDYV